MIQRIQTVYLLLITILTVLVLFLPLGTATIADSHYLVTAFGIKTVAPVPEMAYTSIPLVCLTVLIAIIAFGTIFLYKNRKRQLLCSNLNSLLIVCFYALFFYGLSAFKEQAEDLQYQMKVAVVFPLVDLILYFLVVRKIKADEALVRSLDRIR